jgi:hypothetical protein
VDTGRIRQTAAACHAVTLDFTPGNIAGILTALPAIRGVALPLSEGAARNDLHHFTFDEATSLLRAMPRLS